MQWFNSLALGLLVLLATGCSGGQSIKTANGLPLAVYHRQLEARAVTVGDWVTIHFLERTAQGDTVAGTFAQGQPLQYQVLSPAYPKAIEEVLLSLQEGDSVVFKLLAEEYYRNQALPAKVTAQDELLFNLKVLKVESEMERNLALQSQVEAQKPIEEEKIKAHLTEREIVGSTKRHSSGLYYFEHWSGKGQPADPGDSIAFFLHGSFLNGNVFDLHDKKPLGFVLGQTRVLPGWEIAFDEILTEGSQYSIILPSHLAYGAKGKDLIPPFTPLRFQIGVKKIVRAKELTAYRQGKRP
ncbi:MAG: FKBP-type peptidyl-prolyl cis-trans isomerase [Bernardetiaceae bacterium]|jgi:FKBP-type peptidyl-prolyl cis-trans isomerase|nr:FKBP-type peptidyl-prolyl cis-trans isomerase [Bernardetiaceae bacterium]